MPNLGLGLSLPQTRVAGTSFDPDALAYLTAVEAADGQALESSVKSAINTFVVGSKADGIWTAIKASCILAGARTLSGALVPLAGTAPTNSGFASGDYNRKTGLLGAGATKYLNTNRINSDDPQDSKHMCVYLTESPTRDAARTHIGTNNGSGNSLFFSTSSVVSFRINFLTPPTAIAYAGLVTGLFGATRYSGFGVNYILNGSIGAFDHTSTTGGISPIYVFTNGTSLTQFSNGRISFYSIGENINLSLLNSRITTLMNTLASVIP
jgi:hypothetical protein